MKKAITLILLIGLIASCGRPVSGIRYSPDLFTDVYTTGIDTFWTTWTGIYMTGPCNRSCLPPRDSLYVNAVLLGDCYLLVSDGKSEGITIDSAGILSVDYKNKE